MAESGQGAQGANEEHREPFVSQGDRPEVRLDPEAPLSELRVRDLAAILGPMAGKNPNFEVGKTGLKDFFDKPSPDVVKDPFKEGKSEKFEKSEKLEKNEKNEKNEKIEKPEKNEKFEKSEKNEKNEKIEKPEKSEIKEAKFEKFEKFEKIETGETVFDPTALPGPDPRLDQVIQAVTGMNTHVSQLADQVAELQRRLQG
jgi:hypothetical protein